MARRRRTVFTPQLQARIQWGSIIERIGPWLLLVAWALLQRYLPPGTTLPPPPITQPPAPPAPPAPPEPKSDPLLATVRIRMHNVGCTATIVGPRRSDGRWDLLTAAHCVERVGTKGTAVLKDGRQFPFTTRYVNHSVDFAWCVLDTKENLPFALLADKCAQPGASCWHAGYGVDRPGNVEEGVVTFCGDAQQQARFRLSVSSGDSGSGIFLAGSGLLAGVVSAHGGGLTYGATGYAAGLQRFLHYGRSVEKVI